MAFSLLPSRSAGIIIHNNQLLVMYRQKGAQTYYTFPGGTVEPDESVPQACLREILEETSITASLGNLLYHLTIDTGQGIKQEYFYHCDYLAGQPELQPGCIELQLSKLDGIIYQPMWVNIEHIGNINLYPIEIRDLLISDLKSGFLPDVQSLSLQSSSMKQ